MNYKNEDKINISEVKDEILTALKKCNNNKAHLSRMLNQKNCYISNLLNIRTNKNMKKEIIEQIREFNLSNIQAKKITIELTDQIRELIKEAYHYTQSYQGVCQYVMGYRNVSSSMYHSFINGTRKSINIHHLNRLNNYLLKQRELIKVNNSK